MMERVRLDKWLWAARFFKTRGLAGEAISGGKVHINGERCKASRKVGAGDRLFITRGNISMEIVVVGVNDKRRPSKEAVLLYNETDESVRLREKLLEERKLVNQWGGESSKGKPGKHQRKILLKVKGRA